MGVPGSSGKPGFEFVILSEDTSPVTQARYWPGWLCDIAIWLSMALITAARVFTGASASVKGYAKSSPFAMGKFALRGLAQSLARELAPHGVHVAHFIIDGGIRGPGRIEDPDRPDSLLDPEAIAETYLHALRQPRSAWTWEFELRPWVEPF